jgi:AAA domain
MEKVEESLTRGEQCRSGHGVWFTSVRRRDLVLPTNYVPEIVLDCADLNRAREAVEVLINFWCKKEQYSKTHQLTERGVQRVLGVLSPVTDAAPSLRASVDERDREMVRLTTEQARILDFLDEQTVAAICGNAGTGKTFIAWEKARRIALRGQRVLFVCFNSALREHLSARNDLLELHVHTFHSLAGVVGGGAKDYNAAAEKLCDRLIGDLGSAMKMC